jgi:hypothetical protein
MTAFFLRGFGEWELGVLKASLIREFGVNIEIPFDV